MRILFYGDIVGKIGREAIKASLPSLVRSKGVDFVIANGENATHGKGLNEGHYHQLVSYGVDCLTLGNHWHSKPVIDEYIDEAEHLVRPLNLIDCHHGLGSVSYDVDGVEIRVTNVMGQAFMKETVSSPNEAMEKLLSEIDPCIHIVDFHADSTSEKEVFAYLIDGRVSAVVGTHTHVQTNDARILEGGTAYISDVGMCGAADGVIGFEKHSVINKVVYGQKGIFEIDDDAQPMVNAVIIDIDDSTYRATSIRTVNLLENKR
ncbi:MAG: TIGR00282 family metallophosphoesterase [Bacilli bacterium]|jgi:metallophosphoesterase (TIGR00282 family)|nr:TIGR00282 family metallophosphoesterase [Bacilli bacterium]